MPKVLPKLLESASPEQKMDKDFVMQARRQTLEILEWDAQAVQLRGCELKHLEGPLRVLVTSSLQ